MSDRDAMWTVARRFLSFDEPSVKVAQMKKLRGNLPDSAASDLGADAELLFSIAFALEDALRFTPIAFAVWANAVRGDANPNGLQAERLKQAVGAVGAGLGLSEHACAWCCTLAGLSFPWRKMSGSVIHAQLVDKSLTAIDRAVNADTPIVDAVVNAHRALLESIAVLRPSLPSNVLPHGILIVEGATESVLMPHIADCLGDSFAQAGLMLLAAGGAKQVSKRFFQLRDIVSVPLFCVLDRDAVEQSELIRDALRDFDQLHVLADGEIEDAFEPKFFASVLNNYLNAKLASAEPIAASELAPDRQGRGRTATARHILRQRASLDFDKVEFAQLARDQLRTAGDIPAELRHIIGTIMAGLKRER